MSHGKARPQDDSWLVRRMTGREYVRFLGLKRDTARRVVGLMGQASFPDLSADLSADLKTLMCLTFEQLTCLHDDLERVMRVPYASGAFAERASQALALAGAPPPLLLTGSG